MPVVISDYGFNPRTDFELNQATMFVLVRTFAEMDKPQSALSVIGQIGIPDFCVFRCAIRLEPLDKLKSVFVHAEGLSRPLSRVTTICCPTVLQDGKGGLAGLSPAFGDALGDVVQRRTECIDDITNVDRYPEWIAGYLHPVVRGVALGVALGWGDGPSVFICTEVDYVAQVVDARVRPVVFGERTEIEEARVVVR